MLGIRNSLGNKFQHKLTILNFWTWFTKKGLSDLKVKKKKKQKTKNQITIEFCIFELVCVLNFSFNKIFWFFGTNFQKRGYMQSKTGTIEHHHWILHIQIRSITKFQLDLTTLIFWTKFPKKGHFRSKIGNMNVTIEFWVFELVLVPISLWKYNLEFLDRICPKRVFPVKKRESEHYHWILHVRINLSTKFQLTLIILIFMDQIRSKRVCWAKNGKIEHHN